MAKDLPGLRITGIEGKSIDETLSRITYIPPIVTQMMKVGESTGNHAKMIGPIILLFLGGIIGFVLIAMCLPFFMSAFGNG
jgi:type II secretory pathway component PulF